MLMVAEAPSAGASSSGAARSPKPGVQGSPGYRPAASARGWAVVLQTLLDVSAACGSLSDALIVIQCRVVARVANPDQ